MLIVRQVALVADCISCEVYFHDILFEFCFIFETNRFQPIFLDRI